MDPDDDDIYIGGPIYSKVKFYDIFNYAKLIVVTSGMFVLAE